MKIILTLPLIVISTLFSSQALADVSLEQFKDCARKTEQTVRNECYEVLSQRVLAGEQSSATLQTAPIKANVKTDKELSGLPDSIGGGEFADAAGIKKKSYQGHVKDCKKSADRRWFYIFENGQVWKQVDRRKRRHKNCDFDVVITEDSFGYVMQIDGSDSKIRVDRKR